MTDFISRIVLSLVLAVTSGLSLAFAVGGLLTRATNGPARGTYDVVHLGAHPTKFWLMVFFHLAIAVGAAVSAFMAWPKGK
jgi:hypothetical protein